MAKREFKDKVYGLLNNMVKAMANPHRLEIIDLLAQGERSVEEIAKETELSVANASQHLQVLKGANLVEIKRQGHYIYYKLSGNIVNQAWQSLRELGMDKMAEIQKTVNDFRLEKSSFEALTIAELERKMLKEKIVLIDVRPIEEYKAGHIPNAISIPITELKNRIKELALNKEIIVYCRGTFCVYADEAVELLKKKKFKVVRLDEGFADWKAKELPIAV